MKRFSQLISLALVISAIYWSFTAAMPSYTKNLEVPNSSFSTDRALTHVKKISEQPHGVGFPAHAKVRAYIISELQKMSLETSIQEGYTGGDWGNLSKVTNILTRIKGSKKGKALVLLSHYDSSPHSSLGASDAGSGVATILEGVRAFLVKNKNPVNDIIILITDAEELGLNGADLFVQEHPWAKEVGLVLNFEARGSGGPSYMLMETNRGNGKLITEFIKAAPQYPVTNSLAYSIYKMLPNDTDLTVFREDSDIDGFNFAFIGDHFDYHTARDSYERLDRKTLAHQGSYIMPLLQYFAQSDLSNLKSPNDYIYFNVPFFKLVSYPFDWIWPMFILTIILFLALVIYGLRKHVLDFKGIAKGFLPMLTTLVINGVVGYFCWPILQWLYPQYKDILHGFTYNGYTYIMAFTFFSIGICFWIYNAFKKVSLPNMIVGPICIWLIICGAIAIYLPGASFLILPVFALLVCLMILIQQKEPNRYLFVFLALPALWILAPFVKMFPVGLGLKLLVSTTILTTLIFLCLLPLLGSYTKKKRLAYIGMLLFVGFMISAHFNSGFSEENAKPTSLLYVLNTNTNTAQWATYERTLSSWTAQYLGTDKKSPEILKNNTISSKYNTGFSYVADAPLKNILGSSIHKTRDTLIGNSRVLDICITPQRNVNRLEIYTNPISISKATVNGIALSDYYLKNRRQGKLITHFISNNDYTELQLHIPKDVPLELTLYEASNDLLQNSLFTIPERPKDNIPMPFVMNDAILITKTVQF